MKPMMLLVVLIGLSLEVKCFAESSPARGSEPAMSAPEHLAYPHPQPPPPSTRPGSLMIGIGFMFLSAVVIGPIVRLLTPEELPPPAHSHDEPPGASGHHGPGGTIVVPEPEDTLGHH